MGSGQKTRLFFRHGSIQCPCIERRKQHVCPTSGSLRPVRGHLTASRCFDRSGRYVITRRSASIEKCVGYSPPYTEHGQIMPLAPMQRRVCASWAICSCRERPRTPRTYSLEGLGVGWDLLSMCNSGSKARSPAVRFPVRSGASDAL